MIRIFTCAAFAAALFFTAAIARAESFDVGTLHVDTYGHGGSAVVLVPGLASGAWAWRGTVEKFQGAHTIYVLTLPGFDGRPATTQTPLFATFERDFWTLLESRKIARPVVVGHSLGGTLAIALAEQHPERLRAIVAVDGLPVFPAVAQMTPAQRESAAANLSASIANETPDAFAAYELRFMQTIGTLDAQRASQLATLEAKSDPRAVAAWTAEDLTTDLRPQLAHITIPFVEIMPYAAPSPYTQAQTQAFYESLLAGAPTVRVEPITPARHFAMFDRADDFYADLAKVLAEAK